MKIVFVYLDLILSLETGGEISKRSMKQETEMIIHPFDRKSFRTHGIPFPHLLNSPQYRKHLTDCFIGKTYKSVS